MGNEVARLNPGLVRRGIFGWRDDLHRFILKRDRETKATIFAVNLRLQRTEIGLVEESAMWVEAREHPLDGAFHQLFVIHLVDIA